MPNPRSSFYPLQSRLAAPLVGVPASGARLPLLAYPGENPARPKAIPGPIVEQKEAAAAPGKPKPRPKTKARNEKKARGSARP